MFRGKTFNTEKREPISCSCCSCLRKGGSWKGFRLNSCFLGDQLLFTFAVFLTASNVAIVERWGVKLAGSLDLKKFNFIWQVTWKKDLMWNYVALSFCDFSSTASLNFILFEKLIYEIVRGINKRRHLTPRTIKYSTQASKTSPQKSRSDASKYHNFPKLSRETNRPPSMWFTARLINHSSLNVKSVLENQTRLWRTRTFRASWKFLWISCEA